MPTIKKWLQRVIPIPPTANETRQEPLTPLPIRPADDRLDILTPRASTESLATYYIQNYGLFGRLPAEIRREILILAFGKRTLHVDLRYGPPLVRSPPDGSDPPLPTTHCDLDTELHPDNSQRSSWQWFSCVCHRWTHWPKGYPLEGLKVQPGDDFCLNGCWCACEGSPDPRGCFIGIMGWLLACHMSYNDGMDILFTTNTFHFSSLELLQHLPQLIPESRLATITSLELMWDLVKPRQKKISYRNNLLLPLWEQNTPGLVTDNHDNTSHKKAKEATSPLHDLCRMVPDTFPGVRHLYISLQSHIAPPVPKALGDPLGELERVVLGPIENMVRALGPKKKVEVAIQLGGWEALLRRYLRLHGDGKGVRVEMQNWLHGRFWKAVENPWEEGLGYWVCSGWNDMGFMDRTSYDEADIWGERLSR